MEYRGSLFLESKKVFLAVAKFNSLITERLLQAAKETFLSHGLQENEIDVYFVPGAYELGQCINGVFSRSSNAYSGALALGCVIRGETSHYDYVCSAASSSVMQASLTWKKPVAFGVLTVETLEQAFDRAGGKQGNKGAETALALIEMISLMEGQNASFKRKSEEDFY